MRNKHGWAVGIMWPPFQRCSWRPDKLIYAGPTANTED